MNDLERFKAVIEPYRGRWKSLDLRAICFQAYGTWINLATRIFLSPQPVGPIPSALPLPAFPGFAALQESRGIDGLDGLLRELAAGTLQVSGRVIHFAKIENAEVRPASRSFTLQVNRRSDPWLPPGFPFPGIVLRGWGESLHNLLQDVPDAPGREALDWRLRSLDCPYDGLDDLLVAFLEVAKPPYGYSLESALLEVVAPIPLRFTEDSLLRRGELTVVVTGLGDGCLEDLSVGLVEVRGATGSRRASHAFQPSDLTQQPDRFLLRKAIPLPGASSVVLLLRFQKTTVDRLVLYDPTALLRNPRILAYSSFDQDLTTLRRYLAGQGGDRSADFEIGVALLLHFSGLNVGVYGRVKPIQEEIDLVAFAPSSNHLVLAECTTLDLDANEKLSKFSRRIKAMRPLLSEFTIVPLIFTSLDRAKIAESDLLKATTERIGVAAAEDIAALLDLAGQQKDTDEILAYLQTLLPTETTLFKST